MKSVAGGAITKRHFYDYDSMGNRTSEQIDNTVTTGVFNNLNRLGEIDGGGKLRVESVTVQNVDRMQAVEAMSRLAGEICLARESAADHKDD